MNITEQQHKLLIQNILSNLGRLERHYNYVPNKVILWCCTGYYTIVNLNEMPIPQLLKLSGYVDALLDVKSENKFFKHK